MKPNFNSELVTKASLSRLRYLIHKKCYGCKLDLSCKDFKLSLHSDTRRQRSSGCFRLSVQHCFHGLYSNGCKLDKKTKMNMEGNDVGEASKKKNIVQAVKSWIGAVRILS